ncbi:unnamed protein product [Penicillium discolor]
MPTDDRPYDRVPRSGDIRIPLREDLRSQRTTTYGTKNGVRHVEPHPAGHHRRRPLLAGRLPRRRPRHRCAARPHALVAHACGDGDPTDARRGRRRERALLPRAAPPRRRRPGGPRDGGDGGGARAVRAIAER